MLRWRISTLLLRIATLLYRLSTPLFQSGPSVRHGAARQKRRKSSFGRRCTVAGQLTEVDDTLTPSFTEFSGGGLDFAGLVLEAHRPPELN